MRSASSSVGFGGHPASFLLLPLLLLLGAAALSDARLPWAAAPRVLRLLLDSGGHFAVAALCWSAATAHAARPGALPAPAALLCGALASLLDLDHFLAARALSIDAAQALARRPVGHSLLFVGACCGALEALRWALQLAGAAKAPQHLLPLTSAPTALASPLGAAAAAPRAAAAAAAAAAALLGTASEHGPATLLAVAWFSHLLRDALKRGFSLWPLPSPLDATPRISYGFYLASLVALALLARAALAPAGAPAGAAAAAARRGEAFGGGGGDL